MPQARDITTAIRSLENLKDRQKEITIGFLESCKIAGIDLTPWTKRINTLKKKVGITT